MTDTARHLITLAAAMWAIGWVLTCVIDATIYRWPEAAAARRSAPPAPVRWLRLLYHWPLSLRGVLGARRRAR